MSVLEGLGGGNQQNYAKKGHQQVRRHQAQPINPHKVPISEPATKTWPLRMRVLMASPYLLATSPGSTKPYFVITARAVLLPM